MTNTRKHKTAVFLVVALLASVFSLALSSPAFAAYVVRSGSDVVGDSTNADGDIAGATTIDQGGGYATLEVTVNAGNTNSYQSSPAWTSPDTKFGWYIDTNHDGRIDFDIRSSNTYFNSKPLSYLYRHGSDDVVSSVGFCVITLCPGGNGHQAGTSSSVSMSSLGNPTTPVDAYPWIQWDGNPGAPGTAVSFDVGQMTHERNNNSGPATGAWLLGGDGGMFTYGSAHFEGSTGGLKLNKPVVGMSLNASHTGYWEVASDGGIFSFNTDFYGSAGSIKLNKPIVGMAATPTGRGYWLVASDGGIFAYGDAQFYGSTGSIKLNAPIVGMASTTTGRGYWLVASDGGIFAYGDASFHGSTGSMKLNAPVVGMSASVYDPGSETSFGRTGGYSLIAKDGGIFTFDAPFYGSAGSANNRKGDVISMSEPYDRGYSIATSGGQLYHYNYTAQPVSIGDASSLKLNAPIVGMATES